MSPTRGQDDSQLSIGIGIHLLGAADLGVEPRDQAARMAHLRSLPWTERRESLLRDARSERHHLIPPLQSFLYHAEPAVSRLLLVATEQNPAHPQDTADLARWLVEAITDDPAFLGQRVDVDAVIVREFSLSGFAAAVEEKLRSREPNGHQTVQVAIASGPTEGSLGLILGCIAAGVVPRICPANRQDVDDVKAFDLTVEADLGKWLVRSSAFSALAELDPDRAPAWQLLASFKRLDWCGVRDREEKARDLLPGFRLELPAVGSAPTDLRSWSFYRRAIESMLLWAVARGDTRGLFLARPFIDARANELLCELRSIDPARAEMAETVIPDLDFRHLMQQPHLIERLPRSPLRHFLKSRAVKVLWTKGSHADHGGTVTPAAALGAVRFLTGESDDVARMLVKLGHEIPVLIRKPATVVLQPVGRDVGEDGAMPMLDGVAAGLKGRGLLSGAHLCLVTTEEPSDRFVALERHARQRGFPGMTRIHGVPVADARAVRDRTRAALDVVRDIAPSSIVVCVNPGSKAMNLGLVVAALEWSFEEGIPLDVAPIQRAADGSSVLRLDEPASRTPARLAHDRGVGRVLLSAVKDCDFGLASSLVRVGSNVWEGLDEVFDLLQRIATEGRANDTILLPPADCSASVLHDLAREGFPRPVDRQKRARDAGWIPTTPAALWAARVRLFATRAHADPWRAIHQISAIAERCWPGEEEGTPPWRAARLKAARQLWQWRNESPLGHRVWECPPRIDVLAPVLRALPDELSRAGLTGPGPEINEDLLTSLCASLQRYIATLASAR